MELWAKSVERRSLELTRTNRQLRNAVEKSKKVGHWEHCLKLAGMPTLSSWRVSRHARSDCAITC